MNLHWVSQLRNQSQHLFRRGQMLPAAMVCGAALETRFRYHYVDSRRRGETPEAKNASCWEYVKRLRQAGHIDHRTALRSRDMADVGSRAAHNCHMRNECIGGMIPATKVIVRYVMDGTG